MTKKDTRRTKEDTRRTKKDTRRTKEDTRRTKEDEEGYKEDEGGGRRKIQEDETRRGRVKGLLRSSQAAAIRPIFVNRAQLRYCAQHTVHSGVYYPHWRTCAKFQHFLSVIFRDIPHFVNFI